SSPTGPRPPCSASKCAEARRCGGGRAGAARTSTTCAARARASAAGWGAGGRVGVVAIGWLLGVNPLELLQLLAGGAQTAEIREPFPGADPSDPTGGGGGPAPRARGADLAPPRPSRRQGTS